MSTYLDDIIRRKKREAASIQRVMTPPRRLDHAFPNALQTNGFAVIAEIKRRSPSLGSLAEINAPKTLAAQYQTGGAAAVSVLTDTAGFGGSLEDLRTVASSCDLPTLRKDFILEPVQIDEAVQCGAAAVLLIVAVVGERLPELVAYAHAMGLEALVEVHTKEEIETALAADARIIGVNNRNLFTFEVTLATALSLKSHIPDDLIAIAESGIKTPDDARQMKEAGYQAVLVGQALVQAEAPQELIGRMRRC